MTPGPRAFMLALFILLACMLAFTWRSLSLETWFTAEAVSAFSFQLRGDPCAPLYVIGFYTLAGLIAFPVVILIPLTAMIFGPLLGCLYSLCGLVVNASVLYALGHLLGNEVIDSYAGNRVKQISRRIARHGFLTVALLRLFPVAPFTLINLLSGASPITFGTYTFATIAGISPALVLMTLAGAQLEGALHNPGPRHLIAVLLTVIILLTMSTWLRRKVLKRTWEN